MSPFYTCRENGVEHSAPTVDSEYWQKTRDRLSATGQFLSVFTDPITLGRKYSPGIDNWLGGGGIRVGAIGVGEHDNIT